MNKFIFSSILVASLLLASCQQPLEMTARDGIAAAKGFLIDANDRHPECGALVLGTKHTTPASLVGDACTFIQNAVTVKDLAIDALTVYCGGPSFNSGGPCQASTDNTVEDKLKAALQHMETIIEDVKRL